MTNKPYWSVQEINTYVKTLFESNDILSQVTIRGEVSNFKAYPKALYFSLKDKEAKISVVFFMYGRLPAYMPKDGDEVLIRGHISVYPKEGTYQLYGQSIEPFGVGEALLKLQKLKEKLFNEGLFDPLKKRMLPKFPKVVGIIAGKDSAALKDLVTNIHRRLPLVKQVFIPSLVQGVNAVEDLKRALNTAYKINELDVLIIARGGGAEEDLSAFNDEALVRLVAISPIPTIAAIGHEINLTLVDLVADKRSSTPTGAAEFAVMDKYDLLQTLHQYQQQALQLVQAGLKQSKLRLSYSTSRKVINDPRAIYETLLKDVAYYKNRMVIAINNSQERYRSTLLQYQQSLKALSPYAVFDRGYALPLNEAGKPITSIKDIAPGELMKTQMKDGIITSIVKGKK
jgi:exodeoxyribonuclease VII large subunit